MHEYTCAVVSVLLLCFFLVLVLNFSLHSVVFLGGIVKKSTLYSRGWMDGVRMVGHKRALTGVTCEYDKSGGAKDQLTPPFLSRGKVHSKIIPKIFFCRTLQAELAMYGRKS